MPLIKAMSSVSAPVARSPVEENIQSLAMRKACRERRMGLRQRARCIEKETLAGIAFS